MKRNIKVILSILFFIMCLSLLSLSAKQLDSKYIYYVNNGSDTVVYRNFKQAYKNYSPGTVFHFAYKLKNIYYKTNEPNKKFKKYIGDSFITDAGKHQRIYKGNWNKQNKGEFEIIEQFDDKDENVIDSYIIRR